MLPRRIFADGRLGVEIVPEENPLRRNNSVEPLLFILMLIDVRKDNATVDRDLDLIIRMRIFYDQVTISFDLVQDFAEILTDLSQGILQWDLFPFDRKGEELGISRNDLIQTPVFDFEYD